MLRAGENTVGGIPVEVVRKRVRRINLRVDAGGTVRLTVPWWRATIREGEAFLMANWAWVMKTRERALARPVAARMPVTREELAAFLPALAALHAAWAARLGEPGVAWKVRRFKSIWGSCNWRRRVIAYNSDLARAPRELVEYVVVHEFTHFRAHGHGPEFRALMDVRLPNWRELRRRLRDGVPA